MRHRFGVVLTAALLVAPHRAAADPDKPLPGTALHIRTPSTGKTEGGSDLNLPPGYFIDEPTWDALDGEMKRLQNVETNLRAQNDSLRKSAQDNTIGWKSIVVAVSLGLAAGYAVAKLY